MSLLDSFRPRWKNNDPEVRAEAVRELEDPAALLEVAREDGDAAIRRLAIKKVADPRALDGLAAADPDEATRELARERARELRLSAATGADEAAASAALAELVEERDAAEVAKRAALESVRAAALARIGDPKVLADVARRAAEPGVRAAAIERISDPALLLEVALHDPDKEIAELVVVKIGDRSALEEIERRGKSKRARALASEELQRRRAAEAPPAVAGDIPPERIREALLAQTCRRAESAETDEEMRAAELAFADLAVTEVEVEYRTRFERATAAFAARRRAAEQEAARLAEAERARAAEAVAAHEKALAEAKDDAERAALEAKSKAAEAERAAREAQLRKRFEDAASNLSQLTATADLRLAERAIKRAHHLLDRAKELAAEGRAELTAKLRAARDAVKVRALELREAEEWRRWANVPRLEELCAKVEGLLEATDLKQAAHDLRSAQAEWKTLPAPRDKSEPLWHRFKRASDAAYQKCKEHFHQLDEARAANLARKVELCEKVEALQDSSEWNATTEAIKKLQEEWKAVGPVPREQGEEVWKRFRAACDRFFDRRKAHFSELDSAREGNLARLLALVEKVEALADSTQWISTAEAIKKLQAEWKTVGPAPHKAGEAAWQRFRAACDRFFERRKAEFGKMDAERSENLKKKEDILARLEAHLASTTPDPALDRIDRWMNEWKAVGPAPREQADEVWERFRTACDRLRERTRSRDSGDRPRRDEGRGPRRGAPGHTPLIGGDGRDYRPKSSGRERGRDRGRERDRERDFERGRDRETRDRAAMPMTAGGQFSNKLPLGAIAARLKKAQPAPAPLAGPAEPAASEPAEAAPAPAEPPVPPETPAAS